MQKNAMILSCTIDPGATITIEIMPPAALSSKEGMITLLDADGVKVHRVSYTSGPVRQPGQTIPFSTVTNPSTVEMCYFNKRFFCSRCELNLRPRRSVFMLVLDFPLGQLPSIQKG